MLCDFCDADQFGNAPVDYGYEMSDVRSRLFIKGEAVSCGECGCEDGDVCDYPEAETLGTVTVTVKRASAQCPRCEQWEATVTSFVVIETSDQRSATSSPERIPVASAIRQT